MSPWSLLAVQWGILVFLWLPCVIWSWRQPFTRTPLYLMWMFLFLSLLPMFGIISAAMS